MPPKIEEKWKRRVNLITANNPTWGAGRVEQALRSQWGGTGSSAAYEGPRERAIRNLQSLFLELPEDEKQMYRLVHWPETFEANPLTLPWESAPAIFNLHKFRGRRPTVRLAKWFWRVTLATGTETDINLRFIVALVLVWKELEGMDETGGVRDLERLVREGIKDLKEADLHRLGSLVFGIGLGLPELQGMGIGITGTAVASDQAVGRGGIDLDSIERAEGDIQEDLS